jgi:Aminotransferase class I and II
MKFLVPSSSLFLLLGCSSIVVVTTALSAPLTTTSTTTTSSVWDGIPEGPPDAILGIAQAFKACTRPEKVNVCVGAYRDTAGQPWVLPSVRAAEQQMLTRNENKEYLPIDGDQEFVTKALKFAYGQDAPLDRIAGVQTLSGTGACRIGGQFLSQFYSPSKTIYVPDRKSCVLCCCVSYGPYVFTTVFLFKVFYCIFFLSFDVLTIYVRPIGKMFYVHGYGH